jgi:hypothetical protein
MTASELFEILQSAEPELHEKSIGDPSIVGEPIAWLGWQWGRKNSWSIWSRRSIEPTFKWEVGRESWHKWSLDCFIARAGGAEEDRKNSNRLKKSRNPDWARSKVQPTSKTDPMIRNQAITLNKFHPFKTSFLSWKKLILLLKKRISYSIIATMWPFLNLRESKTQFINCIRRGK